MRDRGSGHGTAPAPVAHNEGREPADLLLGCLSGSHESIANWNGVADSADWHGLAPLLFKRLKQADGRTRVPADVWERLRLAYFAGADRNARLYRALRTVLGGLSGAGIPLIVLKGAFLAEAVYRDVAVRWMCDADLMVPRSEAARSQAVLLDMGGVPKYSEDIESRCRRDAHLPEVVFHDFVIEIHWTIASPTGPVRIDVPGLWDRARPASVAGVSVLALSPEDLLLHLCLHSSYREGFKAGLRPLCDIAEAILRFHDDMDWAQVVSRAHEWGAARYAGLTFHLARSMLGAEVPDDVLARLVPEGIDRRMLATARESILGTTDFRQSARRIDNLAAMPLSEKAKHSRERIFLSRAEMAARYPASRDAGSLFPYYVLRFRDVLRTSAVLALRRGLPVLRSRTQDRTVALANWLRSGKL